MPKVSVLMPVYNTKEEYLREAIESILNQTFTDFEFIIINDGSTNNSEEVILSYNDKRIKYYRQKNQGIANSLNNGLDVACGEYIARMDSDDISLPTRLEKEVNILDYNSNINIVGAFYEIFPKKNIIITPEVPKYTDLIKSCCIGHPTVMFRQKDFEKYNLRYNPEYKCEDYELWSRAIRYLSFYNIQEVLLKYRWHEDNLSKPTEAFLMHDRRVKQNMLDFLTNDKELKQQILDLLFPQNPATIKYKPLERIFSVKNYIKNNIKRKVITILGLKIKIRRR